MLIEHIPEYPYLEQRQKGCRQWLALPMILNPQVHTVKLSSTGNSPERKRNPFVSFMNPFWCEYHVFDTDYFSVMIV
jgi:hypothetical protein